MKKIEYCSGYVWEKGRRDQNEDALCISSRVIGNNTVLMGVVCDGIGSLKEGENASTFAVNALNEQLEEMVWQWEQSYHTVPFRKIVNRNLYLIHHQIIEYANSRKIRMGTTMSLCIVLNLRYFLFQIGDSRIYFGKRKAFRLMTKDEVIKQDKTGKRILNHALGIGKWSIPQYKSGRIRKKEEILICSDGFYRHNPLFHNRERMKNKVTNDCDADRYLKQICFDLIQLGERDNISAVYIKRLI